MREARPLCLKQTPPSECLIIPRYVKVSDVKTLFTSDTAVPTVYITLVLSDIQTKYDLAMNLPMLRVGAKHSPCYR